MNRRRVALLTFLVLCLVSPSSASAFCGFYVSGAEGSLYANATMVVLMRSGTRTVLSMQNAYQGPPESFALVVPVPSVLSAADVHTLPREVFDRVDALSAPRLVEYWEEDPCAYERARHSRSSGGGGGGGGVDDLLAGALGGSGLRVRVEAEFAVGEYDIAILSADDSSDLETWLHQEHYNIPVGAGEVLRPYVEAGTKFFVARVDASRVTFRDGRAVLSPLRVQYDSPDFTLPVRLGLLNSNGDQDLIVHILAPTRYEVANYTNAFIPTNLRVRNGVRSHFGRFYETLFRETIRRDPRTVVTEYAWTATSCDPCPTTPLSESELAVLGADVMAVPATSRGGGSPWTLTRLHYRYDAGSLGDDLSFREAAAAVGGRGIPTPSGHIDQSVAIGGGTSAFQGRYTILHWWSGAITCDAPQRGNWGGPPDGSSGLATPPRAITDGLPTPYRSLGRLVREDITSLGIEAVEIPASSGTGGATGATGATGASGSGGSGSGGTRRETPGGPHASVARPPTGSASRGGGLAAISLAVLPILGFALRHRRH